MKLAATLPQHPASTKVVPAAHAPRNPPAYALPHPVGSTTTLPGTAGTCHVSPVATSCATEPSGPLLSTTSPRAPASTIRSITSKGVPGPTREKASSSLGVKMSPAAHKFESSSGVSFVSACTKGSMLKSPRRDGTSSKSILLALRASAWTSRRAGSPQAAGSNRAAAYRTARPRQCYATPGP
eukprot:8847095-Pyramimonas_sp.AAC.1